MSGLTDIDKIFEGLSENERQAVIKILSEQADSGKSRSLYQLCDADWEELPVDIDTFLESPKYLGNSTNNGTAIYPYWRKAYREIIEQDKIEIALGGSIGSGKASTLDSHIVGPDGYFKMRDAYIGREVIGQDGKVYRINGIFPQGVKSVYKITFNDNTYVKCTEDHLWNIKEASSDENTPYITKSVRWMLDQGVRNERNQLNFKIPVTLPVNFNSKDELPLDPYLVGHLISNAYIDETTIDVSIHEQDIVDKISAILDTYECVLYNYTPDDASKFHIINKFKNKNVSNPVVLSAMNLGLDKNPGVKLIPKIYLHASIEDRIQLLQGMFCSSGYIQDGEYFYTAGSEQLFEDFKYLVESLGGYVIIPKPEPNYYADTDGSVSFTGGYIRNICFRLPNYITPCTSSKHYSRYIPSPEYDKPYLHRFITNIEYVGEEECQCISVDNPEELYLMDNFTVTHNTTAAIYLMIYFVYKLMCLKNIRQYYGLEGNGPVCVCFLNNTLQLSKGVAYDKFMSTVANSPWFLERGEVRGTVNVRYKPRKNIEFIIGSSADQIIGRDIFCAIMDELNFSKGADIQFEKNKVLETYNACFGRIKNRFTIDGRCQGRIFLVSSKKTEYDFLNQYIDKKMQSVEDAKNLFVADAKAFEVKPKGSYSGRMFRVAVGGSNLPSKIPTDDETTEELVHQGYEVYDVPVELRGDFELDINRFIADHLGISVSEVLKFIPYSKIEPCYKDITNPFVDEVFEANLNDSVPIKQHFRPELVPELIYRKPIFIHLDTSGGKGDNCGISAIACMGYVHRNRYSPETGNEETTKQMLYRHVFSAGLNARKDSEISFQKLVDFLYYLKFELGWNIKAVSTDGYMGQFLRQQITAAGFSVVEYVSLDRKPDGYLTLQSILSEQRIALIKLNLLESELVRLERNNITGKVDHPPIDGCFTGDTKISLVDGRDISIVELMNEYESGKVNYVYTCNENTLEIEPQRITKVFRTKRSKVVEVTIDNGCTVRCTDDHRFMMRDGSYVKACELTTDSPLMPLYRKLSTKGLQGYRLYYNPADNQWHYGHQGFIHNNVRNHKVVSVKLLEDEYDVYDISIENTPNFALACGVFVHNSKDIADSLAGALYNATLHETELQMGGEELIDALIDVNNQSTPKLISEKSEQQPSVADNASNNVQPSTTAVPIPNIPYTWNPNDGILD